MTRRLLALTTTLVLALIGGASLAIAQSLPPPPIHTSVDSNGVDLISGKLSPKEMSLSIGLKGAGSLVYDYYYPSLLGGEAGDKYNGYILQTTTGSEVVIGQFAETFTSIQSCTTTSGQKTCYGPITYSADNGDGATLVLSNGLYTYTRTDGSVAQFNSSNLISSLTEPAGESITFNYKVININYCNGPQHVSCGNGCNNSTYPVTRLQSVVSNRGFMLHYQYQNDVDQSSFYISSVSLINLAVDYCGATDSTCSSLSQSWPTLTFNFSQSNVETVTDALGRTLTYGFAAGSGSSGILTTVTPSGASALSYAYNASGQVTSVSNTVGTWTYGYTKSGSIQTVTVTDPLGHKQVIIADTVADVVKSYQDALGDVTSYSYDASGRLQTVSTPEGVVTTYTRDGRGNVTQTSTAPKSGSGLGTITTTAGFDASCGNPVKCNQPNWTKDANGAETDYAYTAQGLLTSIVGPASSAAGGLRHELDIYYTQETASYKNSSGALTSAPSSVWLLTGSAACATAQTCLHSSTSTETGTVFGTNNLLPTSFTIGQNGSPSLYVTRSQTYDSVGNVLTTTDPDGNTTRDRYDADRELIGVIGPDPDGSGPLKNRATRYDYTNGWLTGVDQGTTASQSDADWANISIIAQTGSSYDGLGRKTQDTLVVGSIQQVTQYAYDAANHLICSAVRMNAGAFSALPAACQLSASGSFGPDRITSLQYDAADRVTTTTIGYLTSTAKTEAATTYSADGLAKTQKDANGNLTTYVYDGFDRLSQIQFPTPSNGAVSNTADYEQYGYDADSHIVSDRRRDGSTVAYAYDGAGRLSTRSGSRITSTSFTYDNLGRVLSASSAGQTISYTYDAVGRRLTESEPLGTVAYQYDLAGNRTRIQWPDGSVATYAYDATLALTDVRDPSTTLAHYIYDDLGRRSQLWHANAAYTAWTATQAYGYGPDLNLDGLNFNVADGTKNESWGFWDNAAGQVRSSTSSNALYDWAAPANVGRNYAVDGLNRYTSSGGVALSYDALGDVANDTRVTYAYDGLGKMLSLGNGATLSYDGADRLAAVATSSATTRFLYGGDQIIAEYDANSTLLRRYVPGAATDELAAWYEGAGYGGRRYLLTDRQGSVAAVVNDAGGFIGANTYDDAGTPAASNIGRFQYNGAPWIPEAGLYHMRARDYSTTLGRFMQPDPTGYADGMNIYNYTHSDPINGWNPSGLQDVSGSTTLAENVVTLTPGGSAFQGGTSSNGGGSAGSTNSGVYNPRGSGQTAAVTEVVVTAKRNQPAPPLLICCGTITVRLRTGSGFIPGQLVITFYVYNNIPRPPPIKIPGPNPKTDPLKGTKTYTSQPPPPPIPPPEDPWWVKAIDFVTGGGTYGK